jgi:hypothetical protein
MVTKKIEGRPLHIGKLHPNWTGDEATNTAIHQRLRVERGPAKNFDCERCGKQAYDWSQLHGTNGLDLYQNFRALCRSCHNVYDEKNHYFANADHKGEKHGQHKLVEREVREIRDLLRYTRFSQREIALWYGVHQVGISHIKLGATWGWLDSQEVIVNGNV